MSNLLGREGKSKAGWLEFGTEDTDDDGIVINPSGASVLLAIDDVG